MRLAEAFMVGDPMPMDPQSGITTLLRDARNEQGTSGAMEQVLPLVHEAYLRLVDRRHTEWGDRAHFFGVAARAMRRVLVDYARQHRAAKRTGALQQVPLDDSVLVVEERADLLLGVDEALTRLATLDERLSRVVECRFFGGLTEEETAEVLGVTSRTVRRDWIKARGWLHQELAGST